MTKEISVTNEVLAFIESRRQKGLKTYGKELTPFNGRSALIDLMEELGDALCYAMQLYIETTRGERSGNKIIQKDTVKKQRARGHATAKRRKDP